MDVKTTALAMAITDSELSDEEVSILESGGFSVSRATTPQLTDVSEGNGLVTNPGALTYSGVVGRKCVGVQQLAETRLSASSLLMSAL